MEINKEQFLSKIGSVKHLDGYYLYLITSISMIGCVLNLISFRIILFIKERELQLYYNYLKVYCLISSIICAIYMFSFLPYAPRYHNFYLSYFTRFYRTYLNGHFGITLYFVVNCLDVLLATERFWILKNKLKNYNHVKFAKIIIFIFLACFFINLPSWIALYPISNDDLISKIKSNSSYINLSARTKFGATLFGRIMVMISVFIREFITLLIEFILFIITTLKFRKIIKYHSSLFKRFNSKNAKYMEVYLNKLETKRIKSKRNFTLLTIFLVLISFITRFVVFYSFLVFYVYGFVNDYYRFSATLSIVLKNFSNFFVFYFFNKKFRAIFWSKVK